MDNPDFTLAINVPDTGLTTVYVKVLPPWNHQKHPQNCLKLL